MSRPSQQPAGATHSSAEYVRSKREEVNQTTDLTQEREHSCRDNGETRAALRSRSKRSKCAIWSQQTSRLRQKEASALARHHSLHQARLTLTLVLFVSAPLRLFSTILGLPECVCVCPGVCVCVCT